MVPQFDILGPGCVAVDDLLYVDAIPPADGKTRVRRRERQCGGLGATALVTAARLGCRCAYAGTLGDDELCRFVLDRFRQEGVDVSHARHRAGARPVHSVIIVEEGRGTRTIFYDVEQFCGAEPNWPPEESIRSSRVLMVDNLGAAGMIRAAQIARQAKVPVVADFEADDEPRFAELMWLVDHLVVSRGFAVRVTGQSDPAAAVRRLWADQRQAVVVTCGVEGCWYLRADGGRDVPQHQPAFAVDAVDTTGCGDVFHGAYAATLAWGLDLPARVRFAAATAALKATRRGGQAGIPNRAAVETFLQEHSR